MLKPDLQSACTRAERDSIVHLALMQYAVGASVETLSLRYGIEIRELERQSLQTSAMPILDSSLLSDLESDIGREGAKYGVNA
ncbi:hypothetical protein SAMN05444414_1423 [Roseovarius marisflavi]|mgnify:CR=1 FL=1|uniref:Uncharacterized protein n=1 Tax=Roseovarius marisflavi TaxID=1054996 RepID=A0A1M7DIM0_9RHOB|nr:hypothetical protein SAMN05444414_1423 [Roseovarius marisflavi]